MIFGYRKTVSVCELLELSYLAVTFIVSLTPMSSVVMLNGADVIAPSATVIEAGTTAVSELLVNGTTAPPVGAGALRLTVLPLRDAVLLTLGAARFKVTETAPVALWTPRIVAKMLARV